MKIIIETNSRTCFLFANFEFYKWMLLQMKILKSGEKNLRLKDCILNHLEEAMGTRVYFATNFTLIIQVYINISTNFIVKNLIIYMGKIKFCYTIFLIN